MRFLLFLPLAFAGNSPRVDFDPALAAAKVPEWEAACEKNSGEACGNLGALFALGKGVSQNETKAFSLYEKACRFGQSLRCLRAGSFAANGKGVLESQEKAAELFAIGCRLMDPENCASYYLLTHGSKFLLNGEMSPVQNPPKAEQAMLKTVLNVFSDSCAKGQARACGNLGFLYEDGDAAPRDPSKALKSFERACELGESDRCSRAARYHATGKAGEVSRKKAEALFSRACELEHKIVCPMAEMARKGLPIDLNLKSESAHLESNVAEPSNQGKKSPEKNSMELEPIEFGSLPSDLRQKIEFCNQGDARACGNAASEFLDENERPRSHPELVRRLLEKSCSLGRAQRCKTLARFWEEGWGGEKSEEKARELRARACGLGLKESCGDKNSKNKGKL